MDEGCTQPLSSDPKIHLNTTMFFFLSLYPVCEESPQLGASRPYKRWSQRSTDVRDGKATDTSLKSNSTNTHTSHNLSSKFTHGVLNSRGVQIWSSSTVEDLEPLAHRTLSGAHRTVRCSHLTVGSATRHTRIARPTVGAADRWLTGQFGAPPDSPVIFSRTPLRFSRERRLRRRRLTGQSGDL
jgi:hypothetical protein